MSMKPNSTPAPPPTHTKVWFLLAGSLFFWDSFWSFLCCSALRFFAYSTTSRCPWTLAPWHLSCAALHCSGVAKAAKAYLLGRKNRNKLLKLTARFQNNIVTTKLVSWLCLYEFTGLTNKKHKSTLTNEPVTLWSCSLEARCWKVWLGVWGNTASVCMMVCTSVREGGPHATFWLSTVTLLF